MRQLEAMQETLKLAQERDYDMVEHEEEGADFAHFISMYERASDPANNFSEAKLGHWLGFIQGVLVANAVCTLEEVKELNKRFAD